MKPIDTTKFNESLRFVAKYWKPSLFSASRGWKELGLAAPVRWWRTRAAAAVAAVAIISASAAIFIYDTVRTPEQAVETTTQPVAEAPMTKIVRIEFTDAPLAEVIAKIEEVYGVKVTDCPAESARLTLSYEGNAPDLITTINEILGTEMKVELCAD